MKHRNITRITALFEVAQSAFYIVVCFWFLSALKANAQQTKFLTNGLVAYYTFDGDYSDQSGNRRDGSAVGGISLGIDRFNRLNSSAVFNQGRIVVKPTPFVVNSDYSITFWVRVNNSGQQFLMSTGRDGGSGVIIGYSQQTGYTFQPAWQKAVLSKYSGNASEWHQVACLKLQDKYSIYVDGVLSVSQSQAATSVDEGELWIGQHKYINNGYPYYLIGSMDDVRVYNRALSDVEVKSLYDYEKIYLAQVAIINQPQSVAVNLGGSVVFNVSATNATTYQWTKNGLPLPGATNATLNLANVQSVAIGEYQVVVGNPAGSVVSTIANVNLNGVDSGPWKGLVAYYAFDGDLKDASGFQRNLIGQGFSFSGGINNKSLTLTQQNGRLDYLLNSNKLSLSNLTVSVWLNAKTVDRASEWMYVLDCDTGFQYNGVIRVGVHSGYKNQWSLVKPNQWFLLTAVYQNGLRSLYINDQLQEKVGPGDDFDFNLNGFFIGNSGGYQYFLDGNIDDLRIYNRVFSEAEVKTLYASLAPPSPNYPLTLEVVNGSIQSGAGGLILKKPLAGGYGRVAQGNISVSPGVYRIETVVDAYTPCCNPVDWYGEILPQSVPIELISRESQSLNDGGLILFKTRYRVLREYDSGVMVSVYSIPDVIIRGVKLIRESDGVQLASDPNLTGIGGFWVGEAVAVSGPGNTNNTVDFASAIGQIQATPSRAEYQSGSTVTLKAVPTRAFAFSQWIINGVPTGSANPLTLTVDAAKAVKAEFKAVRFLASAVQGAGRVDRSVVADSYPDGSVVTLRAVAEKGWEFVGWTGSATGAQPQINITLNQDQSVTANFRPVFTPVTAQSVEERQTWQLKLVAGDSTVVGHRLTYRLVSGPVGPTLDAATGTLTWTPGESDGGKVYDFQVAATDTTDTSVENQLAFRLTVAKVNHPPTMAAVANASIPELAQWSLSLVGQDLDLPSQALVYSLVSGPSGMSIDATTGAILWTPTEAQGPGTYVVVARVADPYGLTADRTFVITVAEANSAPVLTAIPDQTIVFGKSIQLQLSATDSDEPASTLTYRLVSGPTGMAVSTSGQLSWTPLRAQVPSRQTVTVSVSDGTVLVSQTFRIDALDLVTLVNDGEATNTLNLLPPAKVSFKLGRADWVIMYSLDGNQPKDTSAFYQEPFNLVQSSTVWPIAFSPDFSQSVVGLPIRVNLLRSQTLTLTGGQGLVHQGPGVAVSAASDSGLPVTLSVVSGQARLDNGLLIPTGGGVVRLKAAQAGNADWASASVEFERLVAKAVQTIAWTPVPEATFRSAPLQLKATASSGLAVTYSVVDGPGSVAADRLSLNGAGKVVVRATQAGTADFEPVTADQTVTVKKAPQTLTFSPIANRVLGAAPVSLVGSASSGLAVVYEVLSGPAKVAGDQLTVTGVGVVLVRASQPGDANFEAALPRDQQFTVTQGQQTLTFAAVGSKTFGDAPVMLSATSSVGLPVTFQVLSGPGSVIGDRLTLMGAGEIVVQASQAGSDQYQAVLLNQAITVAKAPQTINFSTPPTAFLSANGIQLDAIASSGLPVTYRLISGSGAISGSRLTISASGTFTVAADQIGNTNWLTATSVTNSILVEVLDLITLVNGVETASSIGILPPAKVSFKIARPDWLILYSLDGSQPMDTSSLFLEPFNLDQSSTVWPIAFSPDFSQSVVGLPIRVNLLRSQTLSLTGGQGLVHQGPGVAVSAASDSGLPVTLSVVSGPARLDNGLLIPTGGGVVRLKAAQAGNADWASASVDFERLVAKAVQTIAWTPVPEATFRSAPLQLKATASSGLAVTYSVVDGPGSVVADRLSLNGAGKVVVRATQAGTADFEPVTADQTVTVKKAPQTLTFSPIANRVLGAPPVSLVGSASSGLAVVYEVLSGPAKVAGDQLTVTGVGVVLVRASQPGDANFEAALPKDQQFTVTQGQQTLSFAPVGSKTFGDAPVSLSAASSAQLPVTYRVISGPGALSGDQLTLLGAGDIVVQASQAGNDQFQAVSINQTITVAKATQVITFPTLASVGFSTNGVVLEAKAGSGLAVSYRLIAGNGTISGSKLALTGIGAFSVAADQAGNTNWLAATSVTNSFTVTRGVQSIAFAPIGDQVLSVGPVTLSATSSAGLAVTYSVMSGPATVSGAKLTLLNEGTVVVRAINPGSTLWQAAQADQTFQIRKLTTLSVTVAGNIGGTVAVSPVKDQYAPTDTVTLTATATNGFVFAGWSGDLTGAVNPATLTMASVRSVTATFKDTQGPAVVWDQPTAGTTGLEQARLSGTVSDNVGVTSLQWSRDRGAAQAIGVAANGTFSVENLVLNVGTNRFALMARDAAGNETKLERQVVWVPQRVLSVGDAVAVQEGQRLVFPLNLTTDSATVAGLTFKLTYDPAWVADPQVEWGAQAGQSVNNVNLGTAGELTGSFALAGVGLPSGSNRIATVSFRARSVPFATEVIVSPTIVSLGSVTGVSLNQGNAAVSGLGTIRPRRIKGDNNANQRIDVGDAVLISRYEVGLEEKRSWDIGLNDLNQSGALDNGDVIKALRAVVGLDPQPSPGSEGKRRTSSLGLTDALGLSKVLVNTNDVMALELIDGPAASVGQPYRVAVRLNRVKGSLSGLSFTVKYPASLSLTDKQVGALVPGDALPFWNEGAGQVSLAAIRSTAWANATGVAAVLTFVPSAAFSGQAEWPLKLEQAEITGSGFDVRPVDSVTVSIQSGGGTVDNRPQLTLQPPKADGSLGLEIRAPQGATVAVETTSDLNAWTETQRITGQGNGTPVKVTLQADPNVQAKFWRVRVR